MDATSSPVPITAEWFKFADLGEIAIGKIKYTIYRDIRLRTKIEAM